jgi:hypothetical protein
VRGADRTSATSHEGHARASEILKGKDQRYKTLENLGNTTLAIVVGLAALFILFYVLTSGDYAVAKTVAQDPYKPCSWSR